MKRKIFNQLLSKVIMLPFNNLDFIDTKKDALLNYAISYNELIDDPYGKFVSQTRLKSNLNKRKKDLLKIFSDDYRWGHYDDINLLLNMFYPGWKLSECLNESKNDIGRFYLQHIFNIARCFITFRDGIVSFRGWHKDNDILISEFSEFDKIELWNHICRTGTPDLFIAASYALLSTTSDDIMCYVPNLIFLADMPLKKVLQKGVAETHLHANAGISYQFLWQNVMKLNYFKENNNDLWYCRLFRICSAIFIESENEVNFNEFVIERKENFLFKIFLNFMNNNLSNVVDKIMTMKLNNDIKKLFAFEDDESDILYNIAFNQYKNSETFAEMIWIYKMLCYFNKTYDKELFKCFLDYIRYKNNFFKSRIQETAIGGLDYFQNFYNEATSDNYIKSKNDVYYAIFKEQFINKNLSLMELKITPKVVPSNETESIAIDSMKRKILLQIKNIISSYKIFLEKHSDDTNNSQNIGIIYHFIKSNNSDNFSGINCPIINSSSKINCFDFNTMRKNNIRFIDALFSLIIEKPVLSDYIVGIDAASIENDTEPWVFAPVFRHARSHKNVIPYSYKIGHNINNIGFTYHVGEDFRHIASGLRHVDEVLTYFDYRSGDRLGHAIVLGIDINDWVKQRNNVIIPIMEHLENLLWMWKCINTNFVGNVPKNLEFRIMEVAKKIYGSNLNGIDVYTLWRVYSSKFNLLEQKIIDRIKDGDNCKLCNGINEIEWNFSTLLCSHYCPCFNEIYNKPIFVELKSDDISFYKELQDNLINKVEQMGIYIETNPSSNLIIGDISSILKHPILRLNNKGLNLPGMKETCVLTSINSDDPIVFSTFVENEISYIYYALLNEGCKREDVLNWINKIRKHGINSSFIKQKKTLHEMMDDFADILNLPKEE